jgi:hypothetical protein
MDSKPFLECCRLDNERESKNVRLPSREQIETLKRQIRAENQARETLRGRGPSRFKMYRQPKVGRTNYGQGYIAREL